MAFPITPAASDGQIKSRLAGLLKFSDESTMPAWVDAVVRDAHEAAINEIVGTLGGAGYSADIVQQWDRLAEFEKAIALWWALTEGGAAEGTSFDDKLMEKLDRRRELENVDVAVNGVLQYPGPGKIQIGQGNVTPTPQRLRQPFDGFRPEFGNGRGGWPVEW